MSRKHDRKSALDWICMGVGALLLISPLALGYGSDKPAQWHAVILGIVIGALSIHSLVKIAEWEEWARLAAGAWVIVAPWVLGFTSVAAATWANVVLGAVTTLCSAWRVWEVRQHPRAAI